MTPELSQRARQIKLALFDVDGVMTDGTLFISATGETAKPFNILDGLGLKLLKSSGVATGIITGRSSAAVQTRAVELAIDYFIQGVRDKLLAYTDLRDRLGLNDTQVSYMGDDLPDLSIMRRCGLALSPPNAVSEVRQLAHYVTHISGGRGAVREACELIMRAQDTWENQIAGFKS